MDSIIVHQASKTGFVSKGALIALGKRAHWMSVNVSIGYVAYSLHILYLHVLCKMQSCGLGLLSHLASSKLYLTPHHRSVLLILNTAFFFSVTHAFQPCSDNWHPFCSLTWPFSIL